MGVLRLLTRTTLLTSAATISSYALLTRKSVFIDVPSEPIIASTLHSAINPVSNTPVQDICVRRVPLRKINPALLAEKDGLVRAFTAGVFSGPAYTIQRVYLKTKYGGDKGVPAGNLWDREQLQGSAYQKGTVFSDHFEVVERDDERVVLRCGSSPRNRETPREGGDGLFELSARVIEEEGCAEFRMKSYFVGGMRKVEGKPMPAWIEYLHRVYTKLWMETAVWEVIRGTYRS